MWSEAFKLALFEWKIMWIKRIFIQLLTLLVLILFISSLIGSQIEDGGIGIDIFLITFLAFGYAWSIPKDFQYQKISEQTYASPVFFMLHQLPIKNEVLIRSRFAIFYINLIPMSVIIFTLLYFIPDFNGIFTFESYIAFALFWSSIGFSCSAIYPASDVGDRNVSTVRLIWITIFFIGALLLITIPTYIFYDNGLINLSVEIANLHPLALSIFSLILIPVSNWIWIKYAENKLLKEDFDI